MLLDVVVDPKVEQNRGEARLERRRPPARRQAAREARTRTARRRGRRRSLQRGRPVNLPGTSGAREPVLDEEDAVDVGRAKAPRVRGHLRRSPQVEALDLPRARNCIAHANKHKSKNGRQREKANKT